jgi:hypothetical protein
MNHTRKWGPWIAAGLLILVAIYLARQLDSLTAIEAPPPVVEVSYSEFKEFRSGKRRPQAMGQNSVFR